MEKKLIEKTESYEVYDIDGKVKSFRSENFNYDFRYSDGVMLSWGKTFDEDPIEAPAPNILDMEVTTICRGGCKFCFPKGTMVRLSDGTEKDISEIVKGDTVLSYDTSSQECEENKVEEVYTRDYTGVLVTFEMENGDKITTTDNHPFFVVGKGWVEAKNITEDDVFLLLE